MTGNSTERRLAANEVYFRKQNQRLKHSINEVNEIAAEEGDKPLRVDRYTEFYFQCECSDEKCSQRIRMTLSEYELCHKSKYTFIIRPDHEVESIESIVRKEKNCTVVRKNKLPPTNVTSLHSTNLNNT